MSFQAYLDTVKAKTGLSPEDFVRMAKEKGLTKHADLLEWLKTDFGLGTGHARAIIVVIQREDQPTVTRDEQIDKHFTGAKAVWREPYEALLAKLKAFGKDVKVSPTSSYISILRKNGKFAVVQVTGKTMSIGIKRKGVPAEGRYEEAGAWNEMVTHRVRIDDPKQIDDELLNWLRQAYESA